MPLQNFVDGNLPTIKAAWLNAVDAFYFTLFNSATTAAQARTALGLGTISTQSASAVAITGGTITGITDLAVADGGTGASTAAGARTNLGVPGLPTITAAGGQYIGSGSAAVVESPAYTTVAAHATTCDIWNARYNLLTGAVVTFTTFPTADYQGQIATVVVNAAHVLTNAGSIAVQGNQNYTCSAGDVLEVLAVTTTTFRITIFPVNGLAVVSASKTGSVPLQVLKWGALNLNQNQTNYASGLGTAESSTEAPMQYIVLQKCTAKNLFAFGNAAIPAANSLAITVRKNGVDTAITCTIAAAGTTASDISNSVTFYPYDKISLKLISSATMTSTIDFGFSLSLIKFGSTINEGASLIPMFGSATAQNYQGEDSGATSSAAMETPLPACVVESPGIIIFDTTAVANVTTALARNGSLQPMYLYENVLPEFISGDLFSVLQAYNSTGPVRYPGSSRLIATDTNTGYDPCVMIFSSAGQVQNVTRFLLAYGSAGTATESEGQVPMPACTLKNLRGSSNTVMGAVTTTIEVFKNGVSTGLIITFTTSSRYAEDLTHTVAFTAGDLLSFKCISGATTGTHDYNVSVEVVNT